MTDEEKAREDVEALVSKPSHVMAKMTMQSKLGEYFAQLDHIGVANAEYIEKEGEPAVHITHIMIEGAMTHLTNLFMRVNEDEREFVYNELLDGLKDAPTIAAKVEAAQAGQHHGDQ